MLLPRLTEALSDAHITFDGAVVEIRGGHFSRCFEARRAPEAQKKRINAEYTERHGVGRS